MNSPVILPNAVFLSFFRMVSRTTEYWRKIKLEDPARYAEYLQKQSERSKARRHRLKVELQKKRPTATALKRHNVIKEQTKLRQQKYRQKCQNDPDKDRKQIKVKVLATRKAVQLRRERWRLQKQQQRKKLSRQKKQAIRKKDQEFKQRKRKGIKPIHDFKKTQKKSKNTGATGFSCTKSKWNAISKIRKIIPENPLKYAEVVDSLTKNCSPRKRKAVEALKGEAASSKVRKLSHSWLKLAAKRVKSTTDGRKALKSVAAKMVTVCSKRLVEKEFGIRFNCSKKKKAFLRANRRLTVQKFYKREDVSRVLPMKRYATKKGPTYLLQMTVRVAYKKFCQMFPEHKVGYSTFAGWRPLTVRLLTKKYREFCVCVYCINARYKILALKPFLDEKKKSALVGELDLPRLLLCPNPDDTSHFHMKKCVLGMCDQCKDVAGTLRRFYSDVPQDALVTWSSWKRVPDKDDKIRRKNITRTAKVSELIEEFISDVVKPIMNTSLLQHLHTAYWQYSQFLHLKETLPKNWMMDIIDFAKNRETFYEDEPKGAYYTPTQITMHPVVNYYRDTDGEVVRHSVIIFSEDILHDYHAAHYFVNKSRNMLREVLPDPEVRVTWSDGCSAQYKSCGPFADLGFQVVQCSRNYFGSEHGKNDCDGEIGVVNKALDRAICGKAVVVNDAKDAFNWCQENMTLNSKLSKRSFLYVGDGEIKRDRPHTKVKTIPQTRRIHQTENFPKEPGYKIQTRDLSCFCDYCRCHVGENAVRKPGQGKCSNSGMVTNFKIKKLVPIPPVKAAKDDKELDDILEEVYTSLR